MNYLKPCPKPERKKKEQTQRAPRAVVEQNPLEEYEQEAVANWLDANHILYQASAMGAYMHPSTFNKLKRIGCKRSHPDLVIYTKPPKHPEAIGTAIEMKRKKYSEAREDQLEYLRKMQEQGWLVFVCKGAEVAIEVLKSCGYGKG